VIAIQAIQGLSFGLFLPAMVHILDRLAPARRGALAQTAGSIATLGLGSVAGSAIGGVIVEKLGIRAMYGVMSAAMLPIAAAYACLFVCRDRRTGRH
jgi:MFS family permease